MNDSFLGLCLGFFVTFFSGCVSVEKNPHVSGFRVAREVSHEGLRTDTYLGLTRVTYASTASTNPSPPLVLSIRHLGLGVRLDGLFLGHEDIERIEFPPDTNAIYIRVETDEHFQQVLEMIEQANDEFEISALLLPKSS